ncbi:UDP-N-acetyl-D-glucosamine 6-dehydrogenase [Listeria monocytogenes]|uniref:nucleotide sugar dehydrogenase n=1 Tax=Listeria monocytogenes TaxID=1639 RepID=UPI000E71B564|nr:nucleotide sugar dehydrogenase [Listeria monocytogenes]RKA27964.1 UDP-N-acetyl-D-glucosamine 6-dehydrogenase [Listeria monocytogenes]
MNDYNKLENRIYKKEAVIGVIGLGYVGLPLAIEINNAGFDVIGIDTDSEKISQLLNGSSYISDVSDEILQQKIRESNFIVSTNDNYLLDVDIVIICVPTPLNSVNEIDISFLDLAISSILRNIKKGQLIILESTVYPGATEELINSKLINYFTLGKTIFTGFSPERINPGEQGNTWKSIPKIVSGSTEKCVNLIDQFYRHIFDTTFKVGSIKIAETAKLLENTYRFINISFINEINKFTKALGININEVISAAETKGENFHSFYPSFGIGGHCIPIDPFYLQHTAKNLKIPLRFISLADNVNKGITSEFIKIFVQNNPEILESKVLIIGVAYKKNVNDMRESAALKVIEELKELKVKINYYDPYIKSFYHKEKKYTSIKFDEIKKFNYGFVVCPHDELNFKNAPFTELELLFP